MVESGLNEVKNPSELFLSERMVNASGSAIAVTMEGTRPILVEVQALTNPTAFGNPRRTQNGVDMNRLYSPALQAPQDQGAHAVRVAGGVEGALVHEHQGEGAAQHGQDPMGRGGEFL